MLAAGYSVGRPASLPVCQRQRANRCLPVGLPAGGGQTGWQVEEFGYMILDTGFWLLDRLK